MLFRVSRRRQPLPTVDLSDPDCGAGVPHTGSSPSSGRTRHDTGDTGRQRGMDVCLNSLSSVQPPTRSTMRSMVVREAVASAPRGERSMSRTNTAWSPAMKVGTPHTSWEAHSAHARLVSWPMLRRSRRVRRPLRRVGRARATPPQSRSGRPAAAPCRGARRTAPCERSGTARRNGHVRPRPPGGPTRPGLAPVCPIRSAGLPPHGSGPGRRQEGDIPISPGGQTAQDMLVGIASERAAVVPGQRKRSRHAACTTSPRPAVFPQSDKIRGCRCDPPSREPSGGGTGPLNVSSNRVPVQTVFLGGG